MWLVSMYVPYELKEKINFYKNDAHRLLDHLAIEGRAADIVIIGMDANAVADPNHDIQWECYDPATCRSNLERYSEVSLLFNAWRDVSDLSDTWKRHHQEAREYTATSSTSTSSKKNRLRLDKPGI